MPYIQSFPFQKSLLAIAIGAALTPATGWALDLVQEPPLPTSKSAFVAPNVVISIDDSGSMNYGVKTSSTGSTKTGQGYTEPDSNGKWENNARRVNVLKYAMESVFKKGAKFNNEELIPENKLRIAWQVMNSSSVADLDSTKITTNSMRPLDVKIGSTTHRDNFLNFLSNFSASGGTPTHPSFKRADEYLRANTNSKGPWSSDPGGSGSKSTEYLGCRRNYHILMTDGRWNGTASGGSQDGKNWDVLGNRKAYNISSDQTQIYYDNTSNTLSDWAFKSWMDPLKSSSELINLDKLQTSKIYNDAPSTEKFTASKTEDVYENQCIRWNSSGTRCREYADVKIGEKTTTKTVDLEKYWNPKYNPATWPHMVTYTIGFSNDAVTWPYSPDIIAPTEKVPFGYNNSFNELVTGLKSWPNLFDTSKGQDNNQNSDRALDLWHAAINGRGGYYAVSEAEDLAKAFREIIGKISLESAPLPDKIAGGGSTSGYSVSQNNAGIYASAYNPNAGWSGYITATRAIEPEKYACPSKDDPEKICIRFPDVVAGWDGKSTADRLDALTSVDNRNILTWSDTTGAGTAFKWTADTAIAYSNAQKKALLGLSASENDSVLTSLATLGRNIVNYIRGDRSLEGTTDATPLRVRTSRQGDTVNSEIWYTGGPISNYSMGYADFVKAQKERAHVLYVGGNDGMLHGFSAANGSELLAYVPRGVVSGLKKLTDKDYQHQYYVDGSPMTGDIKDGDNWKTMLVGSLGAGGKGYFLLDVTNPGSFTSASVVKDRTLSNSETVDCSKLSGTAKEACVAAEDSDIGNITSRPGRNPASLQEATQITRLNNGRWAVVMGNGYNSTNQRPVLLVQYLDGDRALHRIPATTASAGTGNAKDNGLASPALVDLNGDGKTDVVYAGDNLGNLWKFDMTSTDAGSWVVAFDRQPLFTARGPVTLTGATRDEVQPITAAPIARANDRSATTGTGTDTKTTAIGGMMIAFGTGRNVTANDRRTDITQNVQTLYSVLDNTRYRMNSAKTALEVHPGDSTVPTPAVVGTMSSTSKLAKQSITKVTGGLKADDATITANQELTAETWSKYKGWYLDFPATGERMLKPMQFFDGSNILAVYSESPDGTKNSESDNINESCVPVKVDTSSGAQWRTLVNIMDGKRPTIQLIDTNKDGSYNSADLAVSRVAVNTGTPLLISKQNRIVDLTGGGGERDTLARMPEQSTRPSWRQVK